jgi:putative transposase
MTTHYHFLIETPHPNLSQAIKWINEGDCWDNAVVESFFHNLKTEWISDIICQTRDDARSDVVKYIEMFYNSHRLHSFLGYKNPNVFEKSYTLAKVA